MLYPTQFHHVLGHGCINRLSGAEFVIGWSVLGYEKKGFPAPRWVKVLTYIVIPWAISIHTVTAFLYAVCPVSIVDGDYGRPVPAWLLVGPALLIILYDTAQINVF